jgi:hypothetical protein
VWNANAYCGVVAVFNVQGSSFSRALRRFHTHDDAPPALAAHVRAADVPTLAALAAQGGGLVAAYTDSSQVHLWAEKAGISPCLCCLFGMVGCLKCWST